MVKNMDSIAVAKCFIKAAMNIMNTMAKIKPTAGKPFVKKNTLPLGDVTAIVIVDGYKNGSIAISFPRKTAIFLTKIMVGEYIVDITDVEIKDMVGEICNMLSGQARAILAQEGFVMQGGIPIVVMGDDYQVFHSIEAPVMAIPFSMGEEAFCAIEFCFA